MKGAAIGAACVVCALLGLGVGLSLVKSSPLAGFEQTSSYTNLAGGTTFTYQESGGERSALVLIMPFGGAPGGVVAPSASVGPFDESDLAEGCESYMTDEACAHKRADLQNMVDEWEGEDAR